MTSIAILGIGGRMGHALLDLIGPREGCEVIAGIDQRCGTLSFPFPCFDSVAAMLDGGIRPDVLIDFSHPAAVKANLPTCANTGLPCVVCTTGLDDEAKALMEEAAKKTAVFFSANMSLGINLLAELAKKAAAILDGFDIEIIEKHHHNKLDAPSGTALLLADEINAQAGGRYHYMYDRQPLRQPRDPDEIGIHAVRGGSIVGEHDVLFAGPDEVVTLSHTAYSRSVFANGAVNAALYLKGKPTGMYSMKDLLEKHLS